MPYPFIWHPICLDVAIIYNLSAVVLAVVCIWVCVFGNAFFYYFLLSFFNFIIFHSTLDDKHQAKFVSCFKLLSFLLLSFGELIVNMHVRVCIWVYARIFQLIFDSIAFYSVCVGVGGSLSVFVVTNGYSIENFLRWWFITIILIFGNCVIRMNTLHLQRFCHEAHGNTYNFCSY